MRQKLVTLDFHHISSYRTGLLDTLKFISIVEFQKCWVLKSKIFSQKTIYLKESKVFCEYNSLQFIKKCQILTFKVIFLRQETSNFFLGGFPNNHGLSAYFLLKSFFDNYTLFSKIMPNFWLKDCKPQNEILDSSHTHKSQWNFVHFALFSKKWSNQKIKTLHALIFSNLTTFYRQGQKNVHHFVDFFEYGENPKFPFEIYWPLIKNWA